MANEPDLRATSVDGRIPVVLCIDDEPDHLDLRRKMLEAAGYSVLTADTPQGGIGLFRANQIDIVLLDYWMADMNGLAVAAELKCTKSNVPVIMLSGYRSILDEGLGRVEKWLIKGETSAGDLLRVMSEILSRDGHCET